MSRIVKPGRRGIYELRKTCDLLFGVNRNGDREHDVIKDFRDPRVCRYSLVGLCPHQLFPNTKLRIGPCPCHFCPVPDYLLDRYEKEADPQLKYLFECQAMKFYTKLLADCEEKKVRAERKLDYQNKMEGVGNFEHPKLQEINQKMTEINQEVERLGIEGEIDKAEELLQKLDALEKEKADIEKESTAGKKELLVCEVCAAILSVDETDQRLADHFAGKLHLGYQKIRDLVQTIKEKHEKQGPPHSTGGKPIRSHPKNNGQHRYKPY